MNLKMKWYADKVCFINICCCFGSRQHIVCLDDQNLESTCPMDERNEKMFLPCPNYSSVKKKTTGVGVLR